MKYLVAVRLGTYDFRTFDLTAYGERQMKRRAKEVMALGGRITMLASSADRAQASAQVLAGELGVTYMTTPVLWSDNFHREDIAEVLRLIEGHEGVCDVLVLHTHWEISSLLPVFYAREKFNLMWHASNVQLGEGILIDLQKQALRSLR